MLKEKDLERQIKWFNELVKKAATVQKLTWCGAKKQLVETESLKEEVCCKCPLFVLNGGWCDPL